MFTYVPDVLTAGERAELLATVSGLDYRGTFQPVGGLVTPERRRWHWHEGVTFGHSVWGNLRLTMREPRWPDWLIPLADRVRKGWCPDAQFIKGSVTHHPAGAATAGSLTSRGSFKVTAAISLGSPVLLIIASAWRVAESFRHEMVVAPGSLLVIRGEENPRYSFRYEAIPADRYVIRFTAFAEEPTEDVSPLPKPDLDAIAELSERVGWPVWDLRIRRSRGGDGAARYTLFSIEYDRPLEPAVLPARLIEQMIAAGVPVEDRPSPISSHTR